MLGQDIFVSIAVSRPEELIPLPGALSGAKRMAEWAKANGYAVVHIHDLESDVSVADIRKRVTEAIDAVQASSPLRRIVFYFAGHGAAQTLNDTLWLLSKWRSDSSEAIRVPNLQSVLRTYHPAQVSIIGDSCRATHAGFLDLLGNAVLLRRAETPGEFELDQFLATVAGAPAFMVPARGSSGSYCVFTEVLLSGLQGEAKEERGGVALVTSGAIAKYLKSEVPLRASELNVSITPEPKPGFIQPEDVYAKLGASAVPAVETVVLAARPPMAFGVSKERPAPRDDRAAKAENMRNELANENLPTHFETEAGLSITGANIENLKTDILTPPGVQVSRKWEPQAGWIRVGRLEDPPLPMDRLFADLFVKVSPESWAYAFAMRGFVTALTIRNGSCLSVISREIGYHRQEYARTEEIVARMNAGLISGDEAYDLAAQIRMDKHRDLVLGAIAAHLYVSVGDTDNIRRMASYYAYHKQPIPFDIALLTGDPIRPVGGMFLLDVPQVEAREPRTDIEKRYSYTYEATPPYPAVPILGMVPLLRRAWTFLEIVDWSPELESWREQLIEARKGLRSAPFTTLSEAQARALAARLR